MLQYKIANADNVDSFPEYFIKIQNMLEVFVLIEITFFISSVEDG